MPTIDYNARVDLGLPVDAMGAGDVLAALVDYHPALGRGARGTLEAIITVPAQNLKQATLLALSVCEQGSGREPRAVEVMTTTDFDAV